MVKRPALPSSRARRLLAAVALTALLIGGAFAIGRSADPTISTREASDQPASATQGKIVKNRLVGDVRGWPRTTQNPPGEYSWDRHTCASQYKMNCVQGFMHNGYRSADVEIFVAVASEATIPDEVETAVTVAGHDGLYRRIGAGAEEWIVGIQGTTIAIRLKAMPGTSDADLAEAHAIIESMRTEPRDTKLGFRLVFTLMTNDWDSG